MPLNVRRFYSSLLIVLLGIFISADAQTVPPTVSPSPIAAAPAQSVQPIRTPTAAEIMRDRISKAKAFIAVRNYNAANYELESIRRESADPSVQSVVNVLLMNSYLEQGDYKRAQDFLNEAYNIQKTTKPGAAESYFTIASQIVKGARSRVERYRALGLNPSDRTLPLEAVNDLEKMRETLEAVVTQSKEISKDRSRSPDAMALLEEASTSRSMIARDDYDARKWQNEVADTREELASSHSVILSAVTEAPAESTTLGNQTVAQNTQQPMITNTGYSQPASSPAVSSQPLVKPTGSSQPINVPQQNGNPPQYLPIQQPQNQPAVQKSQQALGNVPAALQPASSEPAAESGPLNIGSLLPYAAKQQPPVYPPAARSMRTTGIVNVTVLVDEQGNVAEVQSATGPGMLQAAARDAIRKWRFRPFVKDGQPVRATGFISFNFTL